MTCGRETAPAPPARRLPKRVPPAAGPCIGPRQRINEDPGASGGCVMARRQGEPVSEIITETRVSEVWSPFLEPRFYPKDRDIP